MTDLIYRIRPAYSNNRLALDIHHCEKKVTTIIFDHGHILHYLDRHELNLFDIDNKLLNNFYINMDELQSIGYVKEIYKE